VIQVTAPAGSGKTVLLRSWIEAVGLTGRVAWVSVERGEQDAQRFWLSVVEQLRLAVGPGSFVEALAPSPEFNGEAVVKRLLSELGSLDDTVVLVIDDLHELSGGEIVTQLEGFIDKRPQLLKMVLSTRRDLPLGLHRLRIKGQLTEVRASDLRFTLDETEDLLSFSGISLSAESLQLLYGRTEGWAAGLRLATLAMADDPEPERFVARFSGSDRTIAAYLLAEVLERQPDEVRGMLLRTSVLDKVCGPLADRLTCATGSERVLHELEDANAFVVSLDPDRRWFRYHRLFADLLALELRRADPDLIPTLHRTAAHWYERHSLPLDAIRHALAADEWRYAAELFADHHISMTLEGHGATIHALLRSFPAEAASDPELMVVRAADWVRVGSPENAAACLSLAGQYSCAVPERRRARFELALRLGRVTLARHQGDFETLRLDMAPLLDRANPATTNEMDLGNDARAISLLSLGIIEQWAFQTDDAVRHLEEALALARGLGKSYIEIACLGHLAFGAALTSSFTFARDRAAEALVMAESRGWGEESITSVPVTTMAAADVWQGRFDEAKHWLNRADSVLQKRPDASVSVMLELTKGMLFLARGRLQGALNSFTAAETFQCELSFRHGLIKATRLSLIFTHLRLGDTAAARQAFESIPEPDCSSGEAQTAMGAIQLAEGHPEGALETLDPVLDGSTPVRREYALIRAHLVDAVARDLTGDARGAELAIERALDLGETDASIYPFVVAAPRDLLERHARYHTAHATLLARIRDVLAGAPIREREPTHAQGDLTDAELRVLRYLPSHFPVPEISAELHLSLNTVRTHMRNIYTKMGVHTRSEAVEQARRLGLLAPSFRRSSVQEN
jgi:LuxR family maltose regulon positive regulatory protein